MAENDDIDLEELIEDETEGEAEAEAGSDPEAESEAESEGLIGADAAADPDGPGALEEVAEEEEGQQERSAADLAAVFDIPVNVSAVLGKSTMQVSSLLKLGRGAVIELDRKVGEAIDIYVNNRLVARGEVVVVEDQLGVTMTEIIKSDHG